MVHLLVLSRFTEDEGQCPGVRTFLTFVIPTKVRREFTNKSLMLRCIALAMPRSTRCRQPFEALLAQGTSG